MLINAREVMPEHAGWIWPVCLFAVIFNTVIVVIRIWSRVLNRSQRFGADDWVAVAAWPFVVSMCVVLMFDMRWGIGVHTAELTEDEYQKSNKYLLAVLVLYYINIDLIRISLSLYYARIFSSSKIFKRLVYANIGLNVAWHISITMAAVFQCSDPRSIWDRSIISTCNPPMVHQYFCSISSVTLDLIALLLPVPMIYKLQLKSNKKRELFAIFFVGYLVPILTLTRLIVTLKHSKDLDADPSYNWIYVLEWVVFESTAGYLGISMPALLFTFRRWYNAGFFALFNRHANSVNAKASRISGEHSAARKHSAYVSISEANSEDDRIPFGGAGLAHPMTIMETKTITITSEAGRADRVDRKVNEALE